MLSIQTFGPLRIFFDGAELSLPPSRKTRALLGYLALTGASQRREHLCEMFWDLPDDPRSALRWSLSKLRPSVNFGDRTRLVSDRGRVQLDLEETEVDFPNIRRRANGNEVSITELDAFWTAANRVLLEDCELPNQLDFTAWLAQQRNEAARLRVLISRRAADHQPLQPEVRERWAERWLKDAPFEPAAARFAVESRRRMGRDHAARALAEEIEHSFREAGLESPDWSAGNANSDPVNLAPLSSTRALPEPVLGAATNTGDFSSRPHQSVKFTHAGDGISLAWASVGPEKGPPLVKAANWLTHLELDWEAPIWSPLFRHLAKTRRFIRYDERGCGLSDWDVPGINLDTFVSDLEMVVDAAGLDRFPLLGISQGAAVSIEYAARHPERVSHLILFGGYAAGWRHTATREEAMEREAVMVLVGQGWGRANPAYRRIFSQTFMPTATAEELDWFDEFQKNTTSAENAVRFLEAFANIDVRHRLADVQAPTLVVHCRDDQRIPMSTGRALAAQIPNAEFVGLDSSNHLLLGREPASGEFVEAVQQFLTR